MSGQVEQVEDLVEPFTIGVVSDTHIWSGGKRALPAEMIDLFRRSGVLLMLHAGDINDRSVLDELEEIAPVHAVRGNNDSPELQESLPLTMRLQARPYSIGLVHGHDGRSARDVALAAFPSDTDLVVYGHSHVPKIEQVGKTVYFNPGSPTDRRWNPHFGVGMLRCTRSAIEPHLILFSRPADLANVVMPWIEAVH